MVALRYSICKQLFLSLVRSLTASCSGVSRHCFFSLLVSLQFLCHFLIILRLSRVCKSLPLETSQYCLSAVAGPVFSELLAIFFSYQIKTLLLNSRQWCSDVAQSYLSTLRERRSAVPLPSWCESGKYLCVREMVNSIHVPIWSIWIQ